ncbi:hypothetical protein BLA39750_04952 [Burkholderia lata]|uniref:Uncharacterized protein n=1 Tax=Burkholderia lata (strain ATCC 17760 / DSM 23089 / LMG 22485 / NCIMB 9086 / R18194 / 383) TaxID=482957 RepID=A0A6P2ZKU3_BURL3|nr:hypothetical protein BLA39750_04952 [Burkholderia lata]
MLAAHSKDDAHRATHSDASRFSAHLFSSNAARTGWYRYFFAIRYWQMRRPSRRQ